MTFILLKGSIAILSITLLIGVISGKCPEPSAIQPCHCNETGISCTGESSIDLGAVFQNIGKGLTKSEKYFPKFFMNNTAITELKDNVFNDYTFDEIVIQNCNSLTTIHRSAFTATKLVTKKLLIYYNPKLGSQEDLPDNTIYDVLSEFTEVEVIDVGFNNFKEIPTRAFKNINGVQDKLKELHFSESFKEIGSWPFFNLGHLNWIKFWKPSFEFVPDYAFAMKEPNQDTLTIEFEMKKVDSTIFSKKAFVGIGKPTIINFWDYEQPENQTSFLDEKAFLPFLLENEKNFMYLNAPEFDCNDCRSYWIKKNNLASRIQKVNCTGGNSLGDSENFKHCN